MRTPDVAVYIATSMDGYIAEADGGLAWLDPMHLTGEDYGYQAFMDSVDTVLLGRNTYDAVQAMDFPFYPGKRVVVLTSRALDDPRVTRCHAGELAPLLADLAGQGCRSVYLDGGAAVRQGLREDLVGSMTVSVVPVLLGAGVPLFGPGTPACRWRARSVRRYESGLMQLQWERAA